MMTTIATRGWTMPSREDLRTAFSLRLKDLRMEKGFKQVFCALQVGVSHRQWSRWETGRYLPHPHTFNALIKLFPNLSGVDTCLQVSTDKERTH